MSDTTGWGTSKSGQRQKHIKDHTFRCAESADGLWLLYCRRIFANRGGVTGLTHIATRPTLHKCQILAHETARLWAGETE